MQVSGINFDEARLREFCSRNGITRLMLFGSILQHKFSPASDIDMLVEFRSDRRVSLFDVGGMAVELSEMLGRAVDLRTPQDLSRLFREDVLREAKLLYAA